MQAWPRRFSRCTTTSTDGVGSKLRFRGTRWPMRDVARTSRHAYQFHGWAIHRYQELRDMYRNSFAVPQQKGRMMHIDSGLPAPGGNPTKRDTKPPSPVLPNLNIRSRAPETLIQILSKVTKVLWQLLCPSTTLVSTRYPTEISCCSSRTICELTSGKTNRASSTARSGITNGALSGATCCGL